MAGALPKTLRYRLVYLPAVLVRGQRPRRLKIPATWPWAAQILEAARRARTDLTIRRCHDKPKRRTAVAGPVEAGATAATCDAQP
jgi:hypothetical protein